METATLIIMMICLIAVIGGLGAVYMAGERFVAGDPEVVHRFEELLRPTSDSSLRNS